MHPDQPSHRYIAFAAACVPAIVLVMTAYAIPSHAAPTANLETCGSSHLMAPAPSLAEQIDQNTLHAV